MAIKPSDRLTSQRGSGDSEVSSQARAIAAYLRGGFEHPCGECLGFELEHFIVKKETLEPVPYIYEDGSKRKGVSALLEELAPYYDKPIQEQGSEGVCLIGLIRDKAVITLEPGAQLEISAGPATSVSEVEDIYREFRLQVDPLLEREGYQLVTAGYHPQARADQIKLIPKDRYHFMDRHFATTGKHGICMMRASASCQVSVDYLSEADAIRKMRIAIALGPLWSFITDTASVFEGRSVLDAALKPDQVCASGLELPTGMVRAAIWDDVDAARSLVPPGLFTREYSFEQYASTILSEAAIFYPPVGGKPAAWANGASFAEVFAGTDLSTQDIEHILSLFFYDARFKRYLEIRQADSMPLPYALAHTAMIKGLFYQPAAVDELERQLAGVREADVALAKSELRRFGYDALIYGRKASAWLEALQVLAGFGLDAAEANYLEPLGDLICDRKTLLDITLVS
jgi:glutamate--cysteine ligase